jgi:hypothetical protein
MSPLNNADLLKLLTSFGEEYLSKSEIVQVSISLISFSDFNVFRHFFHIEICAKFHSRKTEQTFYLTKIDTNFQLLLLITNENNTYI